MDKYKIDDPENEYHGQVGTLLAIEKAAPYLSMFRLKMPDGETPSFLSHQVNKHVRKIAVKDSHFLSYLAGVIDSDGSIGISRRTEPSNSHGYSYREVIQITWKKSDKTTEFLSKLKNIYGGSLGFYKGGFDKKTDTVRYSLDGKGSVAFARDILPYLILKKNQAELLLEIRALKEVRYGNNHLKPLHIWEKEDEIYQRALIQRSRGVEL